jgi:GNAT superfamily N-acetyltransferase
MITDFKIQFLTTAQTLKLRRSVLKPHLSEQESILPGDYKATTSHLGLVSIKHPLEVLCVATFIHESFPELPAKHSYRLRGMATDPKHQGHGLGRDVVNYGLEYLRANEECDLVWCHARESAFTFYEKLGFTLHGPMFNVPHTGPHKVMYKRLIPR